MAGVLIRKLNSKHIKQLALRRRNAGAATIINILSSSGVSQFNLSSKELQEAPK